MSLKSAMRWLLGGLFVLAGLNHFRRPEFYARIMPPYLPWRSVPAAWGLIALLVAVFPANVHMATHAEMYPEVSPAVLWARLPLQGVFLAWAYWYTRTSPESGASGSA